MIDDAMGVQQGWPSFISQLDMPVPDGVMDNAAATEDETSNNASVDSRMDHSISSRALDWAERLVRKPVACSDAINMLADVLLPVIFNTRPNHLHDAYEGIIIENPWLVNKLFDTYKSGEYHKIRRLGVYGSHDRPSASTNVIAGHSYLPSHRE